MSEQNVDVVRAFYESWNGPKPDEDLLRYVAPDFEWVNPPNAVEPGIRHGHEGLLTALANLSAVFSHHEHDPGELVDLGDQVLAWAQFRGRGRIAGIPYEKGEAQLWTLRDGLIVRFEWFHDPDEARRIAGLPPAGSS